MKIKTLLVLLLAGVWGVAGWWWYTCKIKGLCDTGPAASLTQSATKTTDNEQPPAAETPASTQLAEAESDASDTRNGTTNTENPTATDSATNKETAEQQAEATADNPARTTGSTEVMPSPEEQTPKPQPDPQPLDNDEDGIPNAVETRLGLDPNNADTDGDGIGDFPETGDDFANPPDTDNDSVINALDEDDDGDGDPTANEMPDPDGNGDPEDAQDIDDNQIPDYLDPGIKRMNEDDDGDGLSNGREKLLGSNPVLTDSDGDGLSDRFEAEDGRDTDGDGTIDVLDPDDDDDGILTAMENADPDGNGNPGDALDSNDNGKPDYLDTDNTPTELPEQSTTDSENDAAEEQSVEDTDAAQPAEESAKTSEPVAENGATEQQRPETTATDAATGTASDSDANDDTETVASDDETRQNDSDKVTLETSGTGSDEISKARLYFPFRSAEPELADDVVEYFEAIIKQLKDNPAVKIRVTGHTDSVGRGAANRRLGRERAEQVRDMLVKQGAPKTQILVDSKGEGEPIADNQTEAGRKKNRRVELEPVKE